MYRLLFTLLINSPLTQSSTRSLTLDEAVALALASEPSINRARIAHDRSELAELRAQLDRFSVRVDATLEELWSKPDIGGKRDTTSEGGLGLSNVSANLTVPLFTGFRIDSNVDRSRHLERATQEDLRSERKDTAIAVARAYWALRKIDLLRAVQLRALDRLRSAEATADSRHGAGLAPPIDKNRATFKRFLQEAMLADLDGELRERSAELAAQLGIHEAVVLTDTPRVPETLPLGIEELLADARTRRSELQAAQGRLDARAEEVDIARSAYYPELRAFSLFQYGNNPFLAGVGSRAVFGSTNPFTNMAGDFQVGVTLAVNIFDTLHTYTAVKDALAAQAISAEDLRRAERIVEADVRSARAKVAHFRAVRSRLIPAQEIALDNVGIIQKRYESGEALVFELLDSEIELLNIERQITETTAELQLAWLELDASLGEIVGEKLNEI